MTRTIIEKQVNFFKGLLESKGHTFFDGNVPYNVNIIGVRSNHDVTNKFEDTLYIIYRNDELNWVIKAYPITTIAGTYYFDRPSRIAGTAILAPGQYKGVYKIDKHAGKYTALCQRLGEVTVYRDPNQDKIADTEEVEIQKGYFGINIHKAGVSSLYVGRWSAGCQVFQVARQFGEFMDVITKSASIFGNSFTYTLL